MNNKDATPVQIAIRIAIIIVIIILLLLVSFGLIRFVPKLFDYFADFRGNYFSGIFSTNNGTSTPSKVATSTSPSKDDEDATVVEEDKKEDVVVTKPKPSTPAPQPAPTYTAPVYRGPADLSVYIISVLYDGKYTTVNFAVRNNGGSPTGTWRFDADLPRDDQFVTDYTSPFQPSIPAGKESLFTLNFGNAEDGTINIKVDSSNNVSESNEQNNETSRRIN